MDASKIMAAAAIALPHEEVNNDHTAYYDDLLSEYNDDDGVFAFNDPLAFATAHPLITSYFSFIITTGPPLAAIALSFSSLPEFFAIREAKTVGVTPLLPYSAMFANSYIYILYGILSNSTAIFVSNSVAFLIAIYVLFIYLKHSNNILTSSSSATNNENNNNDLSSPEQKRQRKTIHFQFQAMAVLLILVSLTYFFAPELKALNFIGIVGMCTTMLVFIGPLSTMSTVIKLKDSTSINYPLAVATCVNCLLWMLYGYLIIFDFMVVLPNLGGLICGVMQVYLKRRYRGKSSTSWTKRKIGSFSGNVLPTTNKKEEGSTQ
jgi:solute carrier family 50 protein (sugar transporter)